MKQLAKMRVLTGVAAPFIWFHGIEKEERQLSLLKQLDGDWPDPVLASVP